MRLCVVLCCVVFCFRIVQASAASPESTSLAGRLLRRIAQLHRTGRLSDCVARRLLRIGRAADHTLHADLLNVFAAFASVEDELVTELCDLVGAKFGREKIDLPVKTWRVTALLATVTISFLARFTVCSPSATLVLLVAAFFSAAEVERERAGVCDSVKEHLADSFFSFFADLLAR
jgi:hypothetical protein